MVHPDYPRFKKVIKNILKKNLRLFVNYGDLTGKKGNDIVKIPLRSIDIPHFRYSSGKEGVGQGDGEGEPGKDPGEHFFEVEISIDELAEMILEEMELPNIEPKGIDQIVKEKHKYTGISKTGPDSLRSFKRTYREALKRQLVSGEYDPDDPQIYPIKGDTRYKSQKFFESPETSAVLFYMLDVSGSMYTQMDIARRLARIMEILLRHAYKNIKLEYIVHDVGAQRVYTEKDFYTVNASGGTMFSGAYDLCSRIIQEEYNPTNWNIYIAQFSDGDTFDMGEAAKKLESTLIPVSNGFFFSQIGEGKQNYYDLLDKKFGENHPVVKKAIIRDNREVYDTIKKLFKKSSKQT